MLRYIALIDALVVFSYQLGVLQKISRHTFVMQSQLIDNRNKSVHIDISVLDVNHFFNKRWHFFIRCNGNGDFTILRLIFPF